MRTYRCFGVAGCMVLVAIAPMVGCASKGLSTTESVGGGPGDTPDYTVEPIWMSTPDYVSEGQVASITVGFSHNASSLFPMVVDSGCQFVCQSFVPGTLGQTVSPASPVLPLPPGSGQSNTVTFGVTPPLATSDYLYRVTVFRATNPNNKISKHFFVKAGP